MQKRIKNREVTTALIKKTSIEVFSRYGFDKATTKFIAGRCKVAESLIIRYYGSKNGLLLSITDDFVNYSFDFKQKLSYPPQEDLETEIVSFTLSTFDDIYSFNKIYKIIAAKLIADQSFARSLQKKAIGSLNFHQSLKERLDELHRQGKINRLMDAKKVDEDITFHVLGFYLVAAPLLGLSKESVRESLKDWAMTYALGLKHRA